MTVNVSKSQFNLREKLKELERPSSDKLVQITDDGKVYIDKLGGIVNLSNIHRDIVDTAVDIFIYDTSKDSDGGAWRKRTTHTSWYNESLNTATRGSRKDFPAVAVIVTQNSAITIYDGDDPDLPMWMKWLPDNSARMLRDSASPKIAAMNGIIALNNTGTYGGLIAIYFISDTARSYRGIGSNNNTEGYWKGNIAGRDDYTSNNYSNNIGGSVLPTIVAENTTDVAMTVLPNAPIDSATGLPIPTIAVTTAGGLSIIKDDGTVVDATPSTSGWYPTSVSTYGRNKFITGTGSGGAGGYILPVFDSDTSYNITSTPPSNGWLHFRSNGTNADIFLDLNENPTTTSLPITALSPIGAGSAKGMNIFDVNDNSHSDSLVAYVTSHYNTGWQHGDIEGAFLSDTDTTNVGSNLVNNGDFADTNLTNYFTLVNSDANGGDESESAPYVNGSNQVVMGNSAQLKTYYNLVAGTSYKVSYDCVNQSTSAQRLGIYIPSGQSLAFDDSITAGATNTYYYTATTTGSTLIEWRSRGGGWGTYDNFSIIKAEEDRSVNNNPLHIFGPITKTPVATGAELVAYSGFSASNYLRQPFNANTMNHGTSSFCYVMWVNVSSSGTDSQTFVDRSSSNSGTGNPRIRIHKHTSGVVRFYTNGGSTTGPTNIENLGWTQIVCLRRGASTTELYINGKLDQTSNSTTNFTSTAGQIQIGADGDTTDPLTAGSIALVRVSNSAPSAEQVKKMYEDEKHLFVENAKCTLYGSSDAVTSLSYDEVTERLHIGTSSGRSDFQGLRRINNTSTAVTTAISAHDEFIVEQ